MKSIFWQSNVSLFLGHIFGVMQTMAALKIYEFSTTPPPVTRFSPAFLSLLDSWIRMPNETELWLNHFHFTNKYIIYFLLKQMNKTNVEVTSQTVYYLKLY